MERWTELLFCAESDVLNVGGREDAHCADALSVRELDWRDFEGHFFSLSLSFYMQTSELVGEGGEYNFSISGSCKVTRMGKQNCCSEEIVQREMGSNYIAVFDPSLVE